MIEVARFSKMRELKALMSHSCINKDDHLDVWEHALSNFLEFYTPLERFQSFLGVVLRSIWKPLSIPVTVQCNTSLKGV